MGVVLQSVMGDLIEFQKWKASKAQREAREAEYQAMEQHFRALEGADDDDDFE